MRSICGAHDFLWNWAPSRGKSGGILVGIRNEIFQILEHQIGTYFVRVLLLNKADGFKWNLVIVYGATQIVDKQDFLIELAQVCNQSKFPMVLGGDFNIIKRDKEKNKKGVVTNGTFCLMQLLNNMSLGTLN